MMETPNNPATNKLPQGMSEAGLIDAVSLSGYPLQGIVAAKLKDEFYVVEEWSFVDRDSHNLRCLDLYCYSELAAFEGLQVALVLLIECKRSSNPFLFFGNVVTQSIPNFPRVAGLPMHSTVIHAQSSQRHLHACDLLGLSDCEFLSVGRPPVCSAFSQGIPKGDKFQLSGDDPFNNIILPLVKAADHCKWIFKAAGAQRPIHAVLMLNIAVLDAPLIVVNSPSQSSAPMLCPWIRVCRHEAHIDHDQLQNVFYGVDVVHADFFDVFLKSHLDPFIDKFLERMAQQRKILLTGGKVDDLDHWKWDAIRPRA